MPAPERIPPHPGLTAQRVTAQLAEKLLNHGALTLRGRVQGASNTVLYAVAELDGQRLPCVYKPVAGERPLWDFPHGTLARREVAAYEVSRVLGWDLVPPTVLRDGPHGEGMCQLWVGPLPDAVAGQTGPAGRSGHPEPGASLFALVDAVEVPPSPTLRAGGLPRGGEPGAGWKAVGFAEIAEGETALLVHADDPRLRRVAALDAVINNADRKGGHLLPLADGRLYGIDHGVTFHTEDKLRTLLWGWAGEPLPDADLAALRGLATGLAPGAPLSGRLGELLSAAELAALRTRTGDLLRTRRYPLPGGRWPAIPWPLV